MEEVLYLVNGGVYLHIVDSVSRFDYTIYLQTAKRQLHAERADLKGTIRLTPDAKLSGAEKRRLVASVQKAKRDGKMTSPTLPCPPAASSSG